MTYAGNINVRTVLEYDDFNRSITAGDPLIVDSDDNALWLHFGIAKQRITDVGVYTIQVSFNSGTKLSYTIKDPVSGDTVVQYFLGGDPLSGNAVYSFTVALSEPYQFNLFTSDSVTINYLVITSHGGVY